MKGLQDPQFKQYFDSILELDWTGLDLWAVGGIVSDWETEDIDCVILGDWDEARLYTLLKEMRERGPWSPYWTEDPDPFYDNYVHRKKMKIWIPHSEAGKMRGIWWKWPTTKELVRRRQGIMNGAPVQLIQDGTQIYL